MSSVPKNTATKPGFDYIAAIKSGWDLFNANTSVGDARTGAASASQNMTTQTNNAEGNQAGLTGMISAIGNGMASKPTNGTLPSSTSSYVDLAAKNGVVQPFADAAAGDRASMLQALAAANTAAGQRVDVNEYNTDNVRNVADRKYSAQVGGVDRAATIASSQGFAKALSGGMADSTAAATQSNNLSRDFSDLYSKLRSESDAAALAENDATYKTYLTGKGVEIDQNTKVANALNQLYSTTSQKSSNADNIYNSAATTSADRMIAALKNQDAAWLQNDQNSNQDLASQRTLLSSLYNIQGGNSKTLMDSATNLYGLASSALKDASGTQGASASNAMGLLMKIPAIESLAKKGGDAVVKAISGMISKGVTNIEDIYNGLVGDNTLGLSEAPSWGIDVSSPDFWGDSTSTIMPTDDPFSDAIQDPSYELLSPFEPVTGDGADAWSYWNLNQPNEEAA